MSRSKSRIFFKASRKVWRMVKFLNSSSTASNLRFIAVTSISGLSNHFFSKRLPGDVLVKSKTSNSVFFLEPSRKLRTTSRFFKAVASKIKWFDKSRRVNFEMCFKSLRKVLWMYCRRFSTASAAHSAAGKFSSPKCCAEKLLLSSASKFVNEQFSSLSSAKFLRRLRKVGAPVIKISCGFRRYSSSKRFCSRLSPP